MSKRRLGAEKAKELEEKAPGITLSGWLSKTFTHVTLDNRIFEHGKTLVVPKVCNELALGLLSTDNVGDFARIAFHCAPAGVIVDHIPVRLYEDYVLLLRKDLTKKLVTDPDNRMAKRWLDILERRDSERWAQKRQAMALKATATTGGEGVDAGSTKQVKFEFEIVDPE